MGLARAALVPSAANAQTGAGELAPPQQAELDPATRAALGQVDRPSFSPFTLSGRLDSGLGQGSFVADRYARNPYFAWSASIAPAYYPIAALTLSLFAKVSQEVTNSDVDNERQQVLFHDMQLRARYAVGQIPKLGIEVFVEGRLYLPTSRASRYETLMLGALGRLSLIRAFGPVVLGYSGLFLKNFHRYESPVLNGRGTPPPAYPRALGAEDLRGSQVAVGGNNVSFSLVNSFFVSYVPLPRLALSLFYGISQAFTYRRYPDDALTSPYAESGRGQRDTGFGGIDVWFRIDRRFTLSGGVYTSAAPKTDDNRSFRFPFYDFSSTAENRTLFYLAVTATEFFGG